MPNFYKRLPIDWPDLAFGGAVNGEMGDFGGVLMALDGEFVDVVRDYGVAGYERRKHAREGRRVMTRWTHFLIKGREWRVLAYDAWEHRSMLVDAHFDRRFLVLLQHPRRDAGVSKALPHILPDAAGCWSMAADALGAEPMRPELENSVILSVHRSRQSGACDRYANRGH